MSNRPIVRYHDGYVSTTPELNYTVRELQAILNQLLGESLGVDGMFGPMTKQAVINFQTRCGLPATGVVDQATWAEIDRAMMRLQKRAVTSDADAPKLAVSRPSGHFIKDVFEVADITVSNVGSIPARDVRVSVAAPAQFGNEGDVCEFGDLQPGAIVSKSINLAFSAAGKVKTRFSVQCSDAYGRIMHAGYTDHLIQVETPGSSPSVIYDQRTVIDKSQTLIQDSVINRSSIGKAGGAADMRDSIVNRSSVGGSGGSQVSAASPTHTIPPKSKAENSGTERYRKALQTAIFNDGQIDDQERIFLGSLQEAWGVDSATSERLEQEVIAEYERNQSGGGCPNCGEPIQPKWKLCPSCGATLR